MSQIPMPAVETRYDVFLCHNRSEKPSVRFVADALQLGSGSKFFLDEYSIPASVEYMTFIESEMRASASCAIFLGPAGWGPTHLAEARIALQVRDARPDFRIIPVDLPDFREEDWGVLFGVGKSPKFHWVRFEILGDETAIRELTNAVHGQFDVRASGPEAVTPYYIRRQAAIWERSGRKDRSLLLRGASLQAAQRQTAESPLFVGAAPAPFLERSAAAERNSYRIRLGLSAGATTVALALSLVAFAQRNEARRSAGVALARSLAASAPAAVGSGREDERAVLLAIQAHRIDEEWGGSSGPLVTATLSEVLGTPGIGSVPALPTGAPIVAVSGSGREAIVGQHPTRLVGPLVGARGDRVTEAPTIQDLGADLSAATFDPIDDAIWAVTRGGELRMRRTSGADVTWRSVADFGAEASALAMGPRGVLAAAILGQDVLASVDPTNGRVRRRTLPGKIRALDVAPRGDLLAIVFDDGGTTRLEVFGADLGEPVATFPPDDDDVNSFTFDPAGGLVIGRRDGSLWRWRPGSPPERLGPDWPASVDAVAVSSDGRFVAAASGSAYQGLRIWDTVEGGDPTLIPGQGGTAFLAFTRDGRFLISSSLDGASRYWRVRGSGARRSARPASYQPDQLPGPLFAISRDRRSGAILVGGANAVLQVWPSPDLSEAPRILADVRATAMSRVPDQTSFENGGRNFLRTGHITAIAHAGAGGRFATVDPYGYVLVFDSAERPPVLVDTRSALHSALAIAMSPSGERVVVGSTASLTTLHRLAPDGSSAGSVPLAAPGDATVRAMAFEDEDHLLVGDDDGRLARWTVAGAARREDLVTGGAPVNAVAYLGSGRVAVAQGESIRILDAGPARRRERTLSEGIGTPTTLALSDDGLALAAGFADGAVRVWSTDHPERVPLALRPHKGRVRSMTFDGTGDTLLSVADDGTIQASVVSRRRLVAIACDVAWRDLDPEEVQAFFGDASPHEPTCSVP